MNHIKITNIMIKFAKLSYCDTEFENFIFKKKHYLFLFSSLGLPPDVLLLLGVMFISSPSLGLPQM